MGRMDEPYPFPTLNNETDGAQIIARIVTETLRQWIDKLDSVNVDCFSPGIIIAIHDLCCWFLTGLDDESRPLDDDPVFNAAVALARAVQGEMIEKAVEWTLPAEDRVMFYFVKSAAEAGIVLEDEESD